MGLHWFAVSQRQRACGHSRSHLVFGPGLLAQIGGYEINFWGSRPYFQGHQGSWSLKFQLVDNMPGKLSGLTHKFDALGQISI